MRGPLSTVQSAFVAQLTGVVVLLLQVPGVVLVAPLQVPVLVTLQHNTRPGLPHVERAEHGAIPSVAQPSLRSWLRRCTTQLWCCPWFAAVPQGHAASMAAAMHLASLVQLNVELLLQVPLVAQVSGHCARADAAMIIADKSTALTHASSFICFPPVRPFLLTVRATLATTVLQRVTPPGRFRTLKTATANQRRIKDAVDHPNLQSPLLVGDPTPPTQFTQQRRVRPQFPYQGTGFDQSMRHYQNVSRC